MAKKIVDVTLLEKEEKKASPEKDEKVVKKTEKAGEQKKETVQQPAGKQSDSHGPMMMGAALLLLGIVLLVGELLHFSFGSIMWTFIFIIPGAVLFLSANSSKDSHAEGLAILGSMMMTLGIIFLGQILLNMWASWAYAWTLLAPTSIGVAQVVFGKQHDREGLVKNGNRLIEIGLTMFFFFFVFFEILLNISGKNLIPGNLPAFPTALIVLGIFVIMRSILRRK